MTLYEMRDCWGRTESDKRADQAHRRYLRLDGEASIMLDKVSRKSHPTDAEIEACEAACERAQEAFETYCRLADIEHVQIEHDLSA